MPCNFDFSKCEGEIKEINVEPKGWRTPLVVEYGLAQVSPYDTQVSVVWRVKGTTHTFTIYEKRLNVISNANYKKHFEEALSNFRLEYLSWFEDSEFEKVEWKYEYKRQYEGLIIPDGSQSEKSEN